MRQRMLLRAVVAIAVVVGTMVLASAPASAATLTSTSLNLSNAAAGSSGVTYTFTASGWSALFARCIAISIDTDPGFGSSTPPSGFAASGTIGGTALGGSFSIGPNVVGNAVRWQNSTNVTMNSGNGLTLTFTATNPSSSGTLYMKMINYSDQACSFNGDTGSASTTITAAPIVAGTLTSISVTPSDHTPNATGVTYTLNASTWANAAIKCLRFTIDSSATFGSSSPPAGFSISGAPGGNVISSGTFGTGPTTSTNTVSWTNSTAVTFATGTKNLTFTAHNPTAAGTFYLQVQTFGDQTCSTTPADKGAAAVYIGNDVPVSVTIDPELAFTVTAVGSGATCNGLTATVTSTSNTVPFGRVASGNRAVAIQDLGVATNAGGNWTVNMRSNTASAATGVLTGSNSRYIPNSGAAAAMPAAGNQFFGYSTDNTTAALASGNIKSVPFNNGNDLVSNQTGNYGSQAGHNCIAFAVGISSATVADTYQAKVVYTVIPTF